MCSLGWKTSVLGSPLIIFHIESAMNGSTNHWSWKLPDPSPTSLPLSTFKLEYSCKALTFELLCFLQNPVQVCLSWWRLSWIPLTVNCFFSYFLKYFASTGITTFFFKLYCNYLLFYLFSSLHGIPLGRLNKNHNWVNPLVGDKVWGAKGLEKEVY